MSWLCWHKWSKWKAFTQVHVNALGGRLVRSYEPWQERACVKCGLTQQREI